jgi:hypothetical protein
LQEYQQSERSVTSSLQRVPSFRETLQNRATPPLDCMTRTIPSQNSWIPTELPKKDGIDIFQYAVRCLYQQITPSTGLHQVVRKKMLFRNRTRKKNQLITTMYSNVISKVLGV